MSKLAAILTTALLSFAWGAQAQTGTAPPAAEVPAEAAVPAASPDSEHLEKELQSLNWEQFKSVVTAIPKLKSDVDAYGPLGWQYVQTNYKTYHWRKNIDKLKDPQKRRLAELIGEAKGKAPL